MKSPIDVLPRKSIVVMSSALFSDRDLSMQFSSVSLDSLSSLFLVGEVLFVAAAAWIFKVRVWPSYVKTYIY